MSKSNDEIIKKICSIPNVEKLNENDIKKIIEDIKKALRTT